jgi:hypothetical protein
MEDRVRRLESSRGGLLPPPSPPTTTTASALALPAAMRDRIVTCLVRLVVLSVVVSPPSALRLAVAPRVLPEPLFPPPRMLKFCVSKLRLKILPPPVMRLLPLVRLPLPLLLLVPRRSLIDLRGCAVRR